MKVTIRVRPYNAKEVASNQRSIVKILNETELLFDPKEVPKPFYFHGKKQPNVRDYRKRVNLDTVYLFDHVCGSETTNQEIFERTVKDPLYNFINGYNCSVFVYGPTGTGKTFTMLGNRNVPGIVYLTMEKLYQELEILKPTTHIEVHISYIEIYNENIKDLLNPKGIGLQLREDESGNVLVSNIKLVEVTSAENLIQLLRQGNRFRTQHPTDANAESSRSHAVFQVYLKIQKNDDEELQFSKLSMIDLAGSERASASKCTGKRFKEGANINKSLLALGNCINNLAEGKKHIPYRDSKLTRLLKDSLGGSCKTAMIACVSPTVGYYQDTYNTLKYASKAKKITSVVKKNVMDINFGTLEALKKTIEAVNFENDRLRVYIDKLMKHIEQCHGELKDNTIIAEYQKIKEEMEQPIQTSCSERYGNVEKKFTNSKQNHATFCIEPNGDVDMKERIEPSCSERSGEVKKNTNSKQNHVTFCIEPNDDVDMKERIEPSCSERSGEVKKNTDNKIKHVSNTPTTRRNAAKRQCVLATPKTSQISCDIRVTRSAAKKRKMEKIKESPAKEDLPRYATRASAKKNR